MVHVFDVAGPVSYPTVLTFRRREVVQADTRLSHFPGVGKVGVGRLTHAPGGSTRAARV